MGCVCGYMCVCVYVCVCSIDVAIYLCPFQGVQCCVCTSTNTYIHQHAYTPLHHTHTYTHTCSFLTHHTATTLQWTSTRSRRDQSSTLQVCTIKLIPHTGQYIMHSSHIFITVTSHNIYQLTLLFSHNTYHCCRTTSINSLYLPVTVISQHLSTHFAIPTLITSISITVTSHNICKLTLLTHHCHLSTHSTTPALQCLLPHTPHPSPPFVPLQTGPSVLQKRSLFSILFLCSFSSFFFLLFFYSSSFLLISLLLSSCFFLI